MNEKEKTISLEEFQARFRRRYILKKSINMLASSFIVFCGVTAILYSIYIEDSNFLDCLRFMTFDGSVYTIIISAVFTVTCVYEAVYETENTSRLVYFMRLSSAVTEFVIFAVVIFGLSPLVPDQPDIVTYTGFMMHIMIPAVTILCFIFNDAPIGKVSKLEPLHGSWYITIYAVITTFLFGFRILPPEKAPYSFLDFEHSSIFFSLSCLIGIYITAYLIAIVLIKANRKLSWIWFSDREKIRSNYRIHRSRKRRNRHSEVKK